MMQKMKKITECLDISSKDIITKETYEDVFEYWEVQEDKTERAFLIYICDGNSKFKIQKYMEIKSQIIADSNKTEFFCPVLVFEDLNDETKQFDDEYYQKRLSASVRKEINQLKEEKISVYTRNAIVSLYVEEDGINFLEYGDNEIRGYIYNVAYSELKKIFEVQGTRAFRKNSRVNITGSNATKKKVERSFKDYFTNGIICGIEKLDIDEREKGKIKKILYDADIKKGKGNIPLNFWFNHNGVTIFVEKNQQGQILRRKNSSITFDSNCAHIINGAQTMTNMYLQLHEVIRDIEPLFLSNNVDTSILFGVIEDVCNSIKIKTIIIEGNADYINEITEGLNTQIPITEVDIIASQDKVQSINEILKSEHIRIIRAGEYENKDNITILEFAKMFRMINQKPGTSKNLNKSSVQTIVDEALESQTLAKDLRLVIEANDWWVNGKPHIGEKEINDAIIKYGRNYYCSYVIYRSPDSYDDQTFENIFSEFVSSFKQVSQPINLDSFKKNELYGELISNSQTTRKNTFNQGTENVDFIFTDENKNGLIAYLNIEEKNRSGKQGINTRIAAYFHAITPNGIGDFRTVTRVKKSDNTYEVKETYPFSSKTFSEFYDNLDQTTPLSFDNSQFKKELEKKTLLFVIDKDKKESRVDNVEVFEDFSFENYENEAKEAFEMTLKAFEDGDENLFPKSSDDHKFHIRPKALNADDTFEFSNGKEITKRTFYANIDTLNEIIRNREEDDKSA